ncbi:MAG: serine hydrolase [Cyanothece sp. SIO1E1]|nr:serine hydrolase [Cyanothece sp. SIO1E1]
MFKKLLFIFIAGLFVSYTNAQVTRLEYSIPEKNGYSKEGLDSLQSFLEEKGSSSMVILQDGNIIFEWGDINEKLLVHSIRKSLLNSLVGIKVNEGLIDTNQTIGELGLDDKYGLSELEKSARVADVLKSRSGVYHPAAAVADRMLRGMPERDSMQPGEHYYYNNWDFNVLGAILEKQSDESIYELFERHIANPIGMNHFGSNIFTIDVDTLEDDFDDLSMYDGFYQYESSKSNYPAYHFRLSTYDLALYGQLWLQRGAWNGNQIIPESWIESSIQPYSLYNPYADIAYGMLWSVIIPDSPEEKAAFFHTGTGVHMLGVYPESNMVFVHRVDTENEYTFSGDDLIGVIQRVFRARN